MRVIFTLVCLLIVYGSLFPFHFVPIDPAATGDLVAQWLRPNGITDSIGNILLFVPFGWSAAVVMRGRAGRPRVALIIILGLVLAALCQLGQIFIPERVPSLYDVVWNMAGVVAGLVVASLPAVQGLHRVLVVRPVTDRQRPLAIAGIVVLLAVYVINGLTPLDFSASPGSVRWVPFIGFLGGSMAINVLSFLYKAGVFAIAAWLMRRLGWRPAAIAILPGIALLVEVIQLWMPAKNTDITDILLAAAACLLVARMPRASLADAGARNISPTDTRRMGARRLLPPVLILLGATAALAILPHLPGVPGNVSELFGGQGSVLDYLLFSVAVLSLGAGPALAGTLAGRSGAPTSLLALLLLLTGVVSYTALNIAVTHESMADIVGAPAILRQLTEERILGDVGARFVTSIGPNMLKPVTDVFEPLVRYVALVSPLLLGQGLAYFMLGAGPHRRRMGVAAGLAVVTLLWLAIAKLIVVDYAATDNLTELMDSSGPIGGWLYFFLVAGIVAAVAAILATAFHKARHRPLALLLAVVAVPLAWSLVLLGEAPAVEKYGLVFSGMDFLLGPGRSTKLPAAALFMRWSVVQLGATVMLTAGGWMILRLLGLPTTVEPVPSSTSQTLIATLQTARDRRAPTRQGHYMHPFLVNYTASQARFIENLAQHMERPISEVVTSIVVTVREILAAEEASRREQFLKVLRKEPRSPGATYRQSSLVLPKEEMSFVSELAREAGTSHSCAVRHIVAFFVENVEDEDGSYDMDD